MPSWGSALGMSSNRKSPPPRVPISECHHTGNSACESGGSQTFSPSRLAQETELVLPPPPQSRGTVHVGLCRLIVGCQLLTVFCPNKSSTDFHGFGVQWDSHKETLASHAAQQPLLLDLRVSILSTSVSPSVGIRQDKMMVLGPLASDGLCVFSDHFWGACMGFMGAHLHQVISDGTCAEAGSHGEQEWMPHTQECTEAAGPVACPLAWSLVSAWPHRVTRGPICPAVTELCRALPVLGRLCS